MSALSSKRKAADLAGGAKEEKTRLLNGLRNAANGITAPFSCGGTVTVKEPVVIKKDGNSYTFKPSEKISHAVLFATMPKAPFGQGRKTYYSTNVRDALQMKAKDFTLENFDPKENGILEKIEADLLPQGCDITLEAKLYGMNVYQKEGHFAKHKDTPRGSNMVGTLVVCIPSKFEKGDFHVSHRGTSNVYKWSDGITKDGLQLQWCAFYGDTDHRVCKLGWTRDKNARVTLTYTLWRDSSLKAKKSVEGEEKMEDVELCARAGDMSDQAANLKNFRNAMIAVLKSEAILKEGGDLIIPACHMYTNKVFGPKGDAENDLTLKSLRLLKGRDSLVLQAALSIPNLSVRLQPEMVESCADDEWTLNNFPTRKLKKKIDPDYIHDTLNVKEDMGSGSELWVFPKPKFNFTLGDFSVIKKGQENPDPNRTAVQIQADDVQYSGTGYFGNEASYTTFYVYSTFHFQFPPFGESIRDPSQEIPEPKQKDETSSSKSSRKTKKRKTQKSSKPKSADAKKIGFEPPKITCSDHNMACVFSINSINKSLVYNCPMGCSWKLQQ